MHHIDTLPLLRRGYGGPAIPKPNNKKTAKNKGKNVSDDIIKPRLLSHDKQGFTKPNSVFVPTIQTAQRERPYTYKKYFSKIWGAPKLLAKLALVAIVGMAAAYVPPALVHSQRQAASLSIVSAWGDSNVEVWWPTDGARVSGQQPFKAIVNSMTVDKYRMVWQVDGGAENSMSTSFQDYPHKESNVDVTGWNWKGNGPYTISFTAYDNSGNKVGAKFETIYINRTAQVMAASVDAAPATLAPTVSAPVVAPMQAASAPSPVAVAPAPVPSSATVQKLDVWWPTTGAAISGITPFKMMLENTAVSDYNAYWQVDGGGWNALDTNYNSYPHKESLVDVSAWNWKGNGPYTITFVAKNMSGQEIGRNSVTVTVSGAQLARQTASVPVNAPSVAPQPVPQPATDSSGNILSGAKLFVDPNTEPAQWANSHRSSDPVNAAYMDKVAAGAETQWFGNWNNNVQNDVNNFVTAAANAGAVPTMVAYNIPNRDCGGYSSGGAQTTGDYASWIRSLAAGIGHRKAAVILEPDSLALITCLSPQQLQDRYAMLKDAVSVLKSNGQAVYIDAGHPGWITSSDMASRLSQAGIGQADGFALNISNFVSTTDNISYGSQISGMTGNKHFIVDTGRNGNGPTPDYQWCNPWGRALGQKPTTNTGNPLVDAYLWVKGPGGSDGNCNGGPGAGIFWPDYAVGLAQRASW